MTRTSTTALEEDVERGAVGVQWTDVPLVRLDPGSDHEPPRHAITGRRPTTMIHTPRNGDSTASPIHNRNAAENDPEDTANYVRSTNLAGMSDTMRSARQAAVLALNTSLAIPEERLEDRRATTSHSASAARRRMGGALDVGDGSAKSSGGSAYSWHKYTANSLATAALVVALVFGVSSWMGMNYANDYAKKSYDLSLFGMCHDYEDVRNTSTCKNILPDTFQTLGLVPRGLGFEPPEASEYLHFWETPSAEAIEASLVEYAALLAIAVLALPSFFASAVLAVLAVAVCRSISGSRQQPNNADMCDQPDVKQQQYARPFWEGGYEARGEWN
ncbi:hypothetical protein BX600DRAFT_473511 [Xylariales sp. PMI_506]|nr:hypothetical protein BX600DRAFT_473511 [Xylariales sp. PMI_506]